MIINILFLLLAFSNVNSYKILVYSSKFGYSHMNFLGSMADTLHRAGHDVVSLFSFNVGLFFKFSDSSSTCSRSKSERNRSRGGKSHITGAKQENARSS